MMVCCALIKSSNLLACFFLTAVVDDSPGSSGTLRNFCSNHASCFPRKSKTLAADDAAANAADAAAGSTALTPSVIGRIGAPPSLARQEPTKPQSSKLAWVKKARTTILRHLRAIMLGACVLLLLE